MAWRPSHPPHRTVGMPTTANESNVYADVHGILRTLPPPTPPSTGEGALQLHQKSVQHARIDGASGEPCKAAAAMAA